MQQLVNGDAFAGILSIPRQVIGDCTLEAEGDFARFLQHQRSCELLGYGGNAKPGLSGVWFVRFHVCFPDTFGVDGAAALRDHDRALKVSEPGIMRDYLLEQGGPGVIVRFYTPCLCHWYLEDDEAQYAQKRKR